MPATALCSLRRQGTVTTSVVGSQAGRSAVATITVGPAAPRSEPSGPDAAGDGEAQPAASRRRWPR